MSFTTLNGNIQRQPGLAPSALAACITLTLLPSTSLAAPAEETVIVEGSAPAASSDEQDYSVKSTTAGTKMQMTQRDIPQSVSIVSQQRMEDQQLQTLGDVMDNTLGISKSQADSDRPILNPAGISVTPFPTPPFLSVSKWSVVQTD